MIARPGHTLRVLSEGAGVRSLLCVHGLVDTLEIWDSLAPALLARDSSTLVRFDQRAHGQSSAPPGPCTLADLADDAIAVLDACELERATIVGHSLGGIVALEAALRYPARVSGLVLIGTASQCNERAAAWYERIAEAGDRRGNEGLARAIYGMESKRIVQGNAAGIAAVTRALGSLYCDPLTPRLEKLRLPMLLLVGEKDPLGSRASEIVAEASGGPARLEVVPGAGHWLQIECPRIVAETMESWFQHREGRGGGKD